MLRFAALCTVSSFLVSLVVIFVVCSTFLSFLVGFGLVGLIVFYYMKNPLETRPQKAKVFWIAVFLCMGLSALSSFFANVYEFFEYSSFGRFFVVFLVSIGIFVSASLHWEYLPDWYVLTVHSESFDEIDQQIFISVFDCLRALMLGFIFMPTGNNDSKWSILFVRSLVYALVSFILGVLNFYVVVNVKKDGDYSPMKVMGLPRGDVEQNIDSMNNAVDIPIEE